MDEILILGSLPKNRIDEILYERIVNICSKYATLVSSPIDTVRFNGTAVKRYNRALEKITNADLIIGEQSKPSIGQGIEIGYSINLGKDLLIVAKKDSVISELVKGCPNVQEILYYDSVNDLENKLTNSIETYLRSKK